MDPDLIFLFLIGIANYLLGVYIGRKMFKTPKQDND